MVHGNPAWRPGNPNGRRRKVYPPEQVEYVRRTYASGATQAEIAAALGTNPKDIIKLMQRNGIPRRPGHKRGPANHAWKGDAVSYDRAHRRAEASRGKPSCCERCGTTDPAKRYEWANLTGNYADVSDYERMCRACHRRFDDGRAVNQKRCAQCGRVGTRDFRTIAATDETKPIVLCLFPESCRRRRLKDCGQRADYYGP